MRLPRGSLVGIAAVAIGCSRWALRARFPDGYDAVGFLLAVDEFDVAKFQPHFPGYPVYVALSRLAHLALAPLESAVFVSALASAATAIGLFSIAARLSSRRAAWAAIALYAVAPMPFVLGGAALSDGTAAAIAVLAFAALVEDSPAIGGALMGLMLGARASYFPLALSWIVLLWLFPEKRRGIVRALCGGAAGTLAWAVPFVAVVGARRIVELGTVHLEGHFGQWGGSVATRPELLPRIHAFARDLAWDGIAPQWACLGALAVACGIGFWLARPSGKGIKSALVVILPYGFWALFGQNVAEQPRHLLPLVLFALLGIGRLVSVRRGLAVVAIAAIAVAGLPRAIVHARTPPVAAQVARAVAASTGRQPLAVFGGKSIRTLHFLAPAISAFERTWLSEVDVTLERLDLLPRRILVTSEVEADRRRQARLRTVGTFCREPIIDEEPPCLTLFEYDLWGGGRPPGGD